MKFLYRSIFTIAIISIFTGCGSTNSVRDEVSVNDKKEGFMTNQNFVNIARYHYIKSSSNLRVAKKSKAKSSRANYPGQKKARAESKQKDVVYVRTVTPFNQYVQKLDISYNNQNINLSISDDMVNVTYFDGLKKYSKDLTLKEFSQINQPIQIKGE